MTRSTALPPHPDLEILSSETQWDKRFALQEIRFRYRRFDGAMSGILTWELWRRGGAVAVLPYDPVADTVVLIEQFRLPALAAGFAPVVTEVVAGLSDAGEEASVCATRELAEETGLVATHMEHISHFMLMPGGCDEHLTLFAACITAPAVDANGIAGHHGLAEENEDIRVRVVPAEQAIADALAGKFNNAVILVALLWLAAKRAELRQRWAGIS